MKVWVQKPREVKVEVVEVVNPDTGLNAGDLMVTDADGRTKAWSPDEFAERFEEMRIHEWPGYINVMSPDGRADSGCIAIALTADSASGLAEALNEWAEDKRNRGFIVKHLQMGVHPQTGNYSALFVATTETTNEDREYLARLHSRITEELAKEHEAKRVKEIDALEKARELQNAAKVVEKTQRKELERLAEVGKRHESNCGKKDKRK